MGLINGIIIAVISVEIITDIYKTEKLNIQNARQDLIKKRNSLDEQIQETEKLNSNLVRFQGNNSVESKIRKTKQKVVEFKETKESA